MIDDLLRYNTLVVLGGVSILGAAAGLVGAFAVLQKRALTGDAVAHAALPGVCCAFLLWGQRNLTVMLLGALASGVLGIIIIAALRRFTRVREDAAIGVVLSVFPGLGFVLSRLIQNMTTGGSKAGLDSFILGKTAGMTLPDVQLISAAALLCLVVVLLFYKEFKVVTFDPDFARSLGWPVYWLDLLIMTLTAIAVVIGLPAVGIVMMAALLIMPGAAARFWTDRLGQMLGLAAAIGFATGLVGTAISATNSFLPAGPIIVLTGTGFFTISLLLGVRRGAIARLLIHWSFQRETGLRDLLRAMLEAVEQAQFQRRQVARPELLASKSWSPRTVDRLAAAAVRDGLLRRISDGVWELTTRGLDESLQVVRGRRLWSALLNEYPELATTEASLATSHVGEFVTPLVLQSLEATLKSNGKWIVLPSSWRAGT